MIQFINPFRYLSSGIVYKFRLLFGGADGSTSFPDETGKSTTANGNVQVDTALGDQRGLFDGNGDYITTPNHSDFQPASSTPIKFMFTMRFNSKAGFQTIFHKGYAPAVASSFLCQTDNGNGRLIFYVISTGGATSAVATESSGIINVGQDYDIEIEHFQSGVDWYWRIMRDGVQVALSTANAGNQNFTNTAVLAIGGGSSTGFNNFWFNGWLKDFRII